MIKYKKHEGLTENLDQIQPTKIRLTDGNETPENIWCKRVGNHIVLMNHALAFYPFPNWGLVIENVIDSVDVQSIKNAEPSILTLIPEAFNHMVETGFILEDGTVNPDYKDPDEIDHAPENEFEVEIGGFYLYDGEQLESHKNYTHIVLAPIKNGTEDFSKRVQWYNDFNLPGLKIIELKYPLRWVMSKKTDKPEYNGYACYYDTRNGSLEGMIEALAFNKNSESPMYNSSTFRNLIPKE